MAGRDLSHAHRQPVLAPPEPLTLREWAALLLAAAATVVIFLVVLDLLLAAGPVPQ